MKRQIIGLMILCVGILFSSCEEKSRIDKLKDFIEQVKDEGSQYTTQQWEEIYEKFSNLLEEVENYDNLTSEELEEIARLQGEYAATAFKYHAGEAIKRTGAFINGFIDGLSDNDENSQEAD